jgi:threonylcarbamoyladenosine tRNA methylthiotransferase MtaB
MRRGHTAGEFRDLVEHLAMAVPGIAVTGDVIVGFPGEDAAAFRNTYELLEHLPMAGLHVFSYSPRPGTDASSYADQVPRNVKAERSRALRELANRKVRAFRHSAVGGVLDVVTLRRDVLDGTLEALSDNYLRVWFSGDQALQGSIVRVRVERVTARGVFGSVLSPRSSLSPLSLQNGFSSTNSGLHASRDQLTV